MCISKVRWFFDASLHIQRNCGRIFSFVWQVFHWTHFRWSLAKWFDVCTCVNCRWQKSPVVLRDLLNPLLYSERCSIFSGVLLICKITVKLRLVSLFYLLYFFLSFFCSPSFNMNSIHCANFEHTFFVTIYNVFLALNRIGLVSIGSKVQISKLCAASIWSHKHVEFRRNQTLGHLWFLFWTSYLFNSTSTVLLYKLGKSYY